MKLCLLPLFVWLAVVALLVCSQPAMAQSPHHLQFRLMPGNGHVALKGAKEKKALEQLMSGFGVLPPVDGGGNDEWPCFPGSSNPNAPDCASIATGGLVVGQTAYTQSLSACDGNSGSSPNCGQVFWFYEDDTGDTTDDLVVSIVVKQGKNYILDTGPFNFGPNPFAAGSVVVIYDDTAFGTLGQTGVGNGFCAGSTETCVNPVAGVASVTVTTTVGTSSIKSSFNMFLE
ncbi:MAG: hypothetical protein WBQ72_19770 [Terriglobales bacterium]|jgi:hypothetical protein